ncbi:hypothetical protein C5E05_19365 [Pseudoclavibacter sp. AY1H1]|nr:hypothetical protein C5E05_19365 [Pseudoclavibacter sp. AY1H1]
MAGPAIAVPPIMMAIAESSVDANARPGLNAPDERRADRGCRRPSRTMLIASTTTENAKYAHAAHPTSGSNVPMSSCPP